ncbi:MAG: hypothetical protein LBP51_07255 [Deferribacteraceae bacterium]|jgi:hypothetical protein|nr:hypothetical protein [Deferribacteraceae bacterium]
MKLIAPLLLLLGVNAYAQDFADYRGFIGLQAPEQFEINVDLNYLLPDYLIAFAKKHPLKWELSGVDSFAVRGGRLHSILKERILSFSDGACGGLVFPQDAEDYIVKEDVIAAFSDNYIYLYSISSCGMFNQLSAPLIPETFYAVSLKYLCRTDKTGRFAANLSNGEPLYSDNITGSRVFSANSEGCYFLDQNGAIDFFDEYMRSCSATEEKLSSVKPHEKGFSAFAQNIFVKLTFTSGVLTEYEITDGECLNTIGGAELLCKTPYNTELFMQAAAADKLAASEDEYLILNDGVLSAYDKRPSWQRSVYTSFSSPRGCIFNGELIFSDYFSDIYKVNNDASLSTISAVPEGCAYEDVDYIDGKFYFANSYFTFAEPVKREGGKALYRYARDAIISYLME